MKHKNSIFLFILALAGSAEAISFHDYYYGNEALNIPAHEKEIHEAIANGTLDLGGQDLTDLDGFNIIPGLNSLRVLHLTNNKLMTLPEDIFRALTGLEFLSLSYNPLTALPANIFQGLTQLQRIFLHGTELTALPENIFQGLIHLHMLFLASDRFSELRENIFHGLIALRDLNLSHNQLIALPEGIFHGLINLESIDLEGNQLAILPAGIFNGLNMLRKIDFFNNPCSLTDAQLEKNLHLAPNVYLKYKTPEQELVERNIFDAIRNSHVAVVRQCMDDLIGIKVRRVAIFGIDISKTRDAYGNNLLHVAIQSAAERLGEIDKELGTVRRDEELSADEKSIARDVLLEQKSEINDRYMKIIGAIFSCGETCVQDMLSTTNAQGQEVIDVMFGKLGPDSPIFRAIFEGLPSEEEKKAREEQHEVQK